MMQLASSLKYVFILLCAAIGWAALVCDQDAGCQDMDAKGPAMLQFSSQAVKHLISVSGEETVEGDLNLPSVRTDKQATKHKLVKKVRQGRRFGADTVTGRILKRYGGNLSALEAAVRTQRKKRSGRAMTRVIPEVWKYARDAGSCHTEYEATDIWQCREFCSMLHNYPTDCEALTHEGTKCCEFIPNSNKGFKFTARIEVPKMALEVEGAADKAQRFMAKEVSTHLGFPLYVPVLADQTAFCATASATTGTGFFGVQVSRDACEEEARANGLAGFAYGKDGECAKIVATGGSECGDGLGVLHYTFYTFVVLPAPEAVDGDCNWEKRENQVSAGLFGDDDPGVPQESAKENCLASGLMGGCGAITCIDGLCTMRDGLDFVDQEGATTYVPSVQCYPPPGTGGGSDADPWSGVGGVYGDSEGGDGDVGYGGEVDHTNVGHEEPEVEYRYVRVGHGRCEGSIQVKSNAGSVEECFQLAEANDECKEKKTISYGNLDLDGQCWCGKELECRPSEIMGKWNLDKGYSVWEKQATTGMVEVFGPWIGHHYDLDAGESHAWCRTADRVGDFEFRFEARDDLGGRCEGAWCCKRAISLVNMTDVMAMRKHEVRLYTSLVADPENDTLAELEVSFFTEKSEYGHLLQTFAAMLRLHQYVYAQGLLHKLGLISREEAEDECAPILDACECGFSSTCAWAEGKCTAKADEGKCIYPKLDGELRGRLSEDGVFPRDTSEARCAEASHCKGISCIGKRCMQMRENIVYNTTDTTKGVLLEVFKGMEGNQVSILLESSEFKNNEVSSFSLENSDGGFVVRLTGNSGARLSANFTPEKTGTYTFWVRAFGNADLHVNGEKIAWTTSG